ncbi:MAG TPA: PHB depolymerase family esterase [Candidatus Binatia bacterium]|nr:PHB depolymerase family esterase [Candidatus Binatia bacterium]
MRAALAAMLAAAALALAGCDGPSAPAARTSFERYSYGNDAGTRTYKVYVPRSYTGEPVPLLVELHGCGSDADEEARWSRFNALAERFGILVAYPEQDPDANGSQCWNWFLEEHQSRDAGEPSLIAGITREVMARWRVDPRRVYVGGISAGGAMSDIMAVTYPELYAAAMIYAGCEYKGGPTCLGSTGTLSGDQSGAESIAAMGPRARTVPVIVIQGDADPLVPPDNAELVVQQFLAIADTMDDGSNNASVARAPAATRSGQKPDGQSYDVDQYRDASGCLLVERWLIHGMGHMWSNADSDGSPRDEVLTDPAGPDVSTPTLDFLLAHPMPASGGRCSAKG